MCWSLYQEVKFLWHTCSEYGMLNMMTVGGYYLYCSAVQCAIITALDYSTWDKLDRTSKSGMVVSRMYINHEMR